MKFFRDSQKSNTASPARKKQIGGMPQGCPEMPLYGQYYPASREISSHCEKHGAVKITRENEGKERNRSHCRLHCKGKTFGVWNIDIIHELYKLNSKIVQCK